ncbi:MAG: sugar ABC transporter permease [Treponema sp.]|nr:sugar ABC transporter permease [Treponema sp.]
MKLQQNSYIWRIILLMLPGVMMLILFTLYPIIKMFIMSFFNWNIGLGQVSHFVGLKNYQDVFTDPVARRALVNTLYYAALTVPFQIAFGLFVALLIYGIHWLSVTFRLLYYLPVITSWVVVALLFRNIFSNRGLINYLLVNVLSIASEPVGWLSTRWPALTATAVLGVWKGIGWNMVIFLAALQAVPIEYYEASSCDGLGKIRQFFYITLPCIKGTVLFALVMLLIGAFNTFTPIQVITGGNPAHQTQVALTWMYFQTFSTTGKMGYSAAMSFIITIFITVIAVFLFRVLKTEEKE